MNFTKTIVLTVILASMALFVSALGEGRDMCTTSFTEGLIDGYAMENTEGSVSGIMHLPKQVGSIEVKAVGTSNLGEKITLEGTTKFSSIVQHDGYFVLQGYTVMLTVIEGNARMGLPNVATEVYFHPKDDIVYVIYDNQYLEETRLLFSGGCN